MPRGCPRQTTPHSSSRAGCFRSRRPSRCSPVRAADPEAIVREHAARVVGADADAAAAARAEIDAKAKPRGTLGRLEELACRIASVRGLVSEPLTAIAVLAAGDHGVARE